MSHFVALVLVPKEYESNVYDAVSELIEPYNENTRVDEHGTECWCVGNIANSYAVEKVNEQLGCLEEVERVAYREMHTKKSVELAGGEEEWIKLESSEDLKRKFDIHEEASKILEPEWDKLTAHRKDLLKKFESEHELYEKPDPNCETCDGSGIEMTSYNPNSKWDWWQIGGRWSGILKEGCNPSEDPRNQEVCIQCNGTGKREDSIGNSIREQDPSYTCNGCDGKGISVKWPTEWVVDEGNGVPVSDIPKDFIPYTLVTPDGEWHQRGDMGWWGMSTNEKEEDSWAEECGDIFKEYADTHLAVVIDCHI